MALALEISITRRLENSLTRWLVDFTHVTVLRRMEGARHRGGMF